jgi:hypothetical protein
MRLWITILMVHRAFQLLLTSACRFSHFISQEVEAMRRTMYNDPKLAYEDKSCTQHLAFIMEVSCGWKWFGGQKLKKRNFFGSTLSLAPPVAGWRHSGAPWFGLAAQQAVSVSWKALIGWSSLTIMSSRNQICLH